MPAGVASAAVEKIGRASDSGTKPVLNEQQLRQQREKIYKEKVPAFNL